jgi:hypothetical protein
MDEQRKETLMARLWGWRVPKRGLGLLITDDGLALAQSQATVSSGGQHCAWHWHRWSANDTQQTSGAWPDPVQLKKALARSGFQAQATAVAVPEAQLQRFSLSLEPGQSKRQMHAAIAAQLGNLLPHPVHESVWDFELQEAQAPAHAAPHAQPAWLQAAMQAQAAPTAEVLVLTRAWVSACEHFCRAAGLQLVRLEPPWQASSRWQVFAQNHADRASAPVAQALTAQQQAVLGGLALGVVMP